MALFFPRMYYMHTLGVFWIGFWCPLSRTAHNHSQVSCTWTVVLSILIISWSLQEYMHKFRLRSRPCSWYPEQIFMSGWLKWNSCKQKYCSSSTDVKVVKSQSWIWVLTFRPNQVLQYVPNIRLLVYASGLDAIWKWHISWSFEMFTDRAELERSFGMLLFCARRKCLMPFMSLVLCTASHSLTMMDSVVYYHYPALINWNEMWQPALTMQVTRQASSLTL